jgi:hypothetical protein
MSYGNQTRVNFYADENDAFPDGQAAGSSYAKAREFLGNHLSWVVGWDDPDNRTINNLEIASTQMTSLFAYETIQATNFVVNSGARVHLRAQEQVLLGSGTHIRAGSELRMQALPCIETPGFRLATTTPTKNPKLAMNFGSTDPLTGSPEGAASTNRI